MWINCEESIRYLGESKRKKKIYAQEKAVTKNEKR